TPLQSDCVACIPYRAARRAADSSAAVDLIRRCGLRAAHPIGLRAALSLDLLEPLHAAAGADLGGVEAALGVDREVVHPLDLPGHPPGPADPRQHLAGVA